MFKKYALKVTNTLGSLNQGAHRSPKLSRSDSDGSTYSSDYDYIPTEVNRDLFIENYLIGRGSVGGGGDSPKIIMRSTSLNEDNLADAATRFNNSRRKSSLEKRDDRLMINKNQLFACKTEKVDRAVSKHRISIDIYQPENDLDERNINYDNNTYNSESSLKKLNNFRDFFDLELSREIFLREIPNAVHFKLVFSSFSHRRKLFTWSDILSTSSDYGDIKSQNCSLLVRCQIAPRR